MDKRIFTNPILFLFLISMVLLVLLDLYDFVVSIVEGIASGEDFRAMLILEGKGLDSALLKMIFCIFCIKCVKPLLYKKDLKKGN